MTKKAPDREVKGSPFDQGVDEEIAYKVDTAQWPGTGEVTNEAVVLKDSEGTDVSSTKLSGNVSEAAGIITTPKVVDLEAGKSYRLEVKWEKSGNLLECFLILNGTA